MFVSDSINEILGYEVNEITKMKLKDIIIQECMKDKTLTYEQLNDFFKQDYDKLLENIKGLIRCHIRFYKLKKLPNKKHLIYGN